MNGHENIGHRGAKTIIGKLSGKKIIIPNVNDPPMAVMAPPGVIHNGTPVNGFESINTSRGISGLQSFQRQFGLLIPATNTIMEPDLWRIIVTNQGPGGLKGAGLHTSTVLTPKPDVGQQRGWKPSSGSSLAASSPQRRAHCWPILST
jgi:maleate isomerase